MKKIIFLWVLFLIFPLKSYSLVEYHNESNSFRSAPPKIPKRTPPKIKSLKTRIKTRTPYQRTSSKLFDLSMGVETIDTETNEKNSSFVLDTFVQTPYNIFLTSSLRYARISSEKTGKKRQGNPTVIIGVNWLRFGNINDRVTVDFYGGLRFGQQDSTIATSRTDKIVGFHTSKRFHTFTFGIGIEEHLTGIPGLKSGEPAIGNIRKLGSFLSWQSGKDILFLLKGGTYQISANDETVDLKALPFDISWGYLSPMLKLTLSPATSLFLGADFRTHISAKTFPLQKARLWDFPGVYGTGLKTGLSINL